MHVSRSESALGGGGGPADDVNANVYMERLKVLRARCGLDGEATSGGGGLGRPMSTGSLGESVS